MIRRSEWRRSAGVVAAIGALYALGAATSASADTWKGETHGKLERSSRLVSGGTTWHGSFWFTTSRRGTVRGQAVIAYDPRLDLSGLNNAIGYIRGSLGVGTGLLGPFAGPIASAGLSSIVGAGVSFDSAMAIRRLPLSGSLAGGRLTLRASNPKGIAYDTNLVLVTGSERIGGGRAGLRSPFRGSGRVVGRRFALHSTENRSREGGVTEQVGSYWTATRIGP